MKSLIFSVAVVSAIGYLGFKNHPWVLNQFERVHYSIENAADSVNTTDAQNSAQGLASKVQKELNDINNPIEKQQAIALTEADIHALEVRIAQLEQTLVESQPAEVTQLREPVVAAVELTGGNDYDYESNKIDENQSQQERLRSLARIAEDMELRAAEYFSGL